VEVHARQAGTDSQGLKPAQHVSGLQGRADLGREHQSRALPELPGCKLFCGLALAVIAHGRGGGVGEWDGPTRLLRLGLAQLKAG